MGLESGVRRTQETEDHELREFSQQREHFARFKDWAQRKSRIAVAALVLSSAVPTELHAQGTVEQSSDTLTKLDIQDSNGSITVASGHVLEIPKAGGVLEKVTVYAPRGARPDRIVVVYGQAHALTEQQLQIHRATEADRQDLLALTRYSQKLIYDQLNSVVHADSKPVVCVEGVGDNDPNYPTTHEIVAFHRENQIGAIWLSVGAFFDPATRALFQRYEDLVLRGGVMTKEQSNELQNDILPRLAPNITKENLIASDAATELAVEGQIHLCGAEEPATVAALVPFVTESANLSLEQLQAPEYIARRRKIVIEDREDAALRRVEAQGKEIAYLVFGARHDFAAATARWDAAHPNEQIAVVQVRFHKMEQSEQK